MAQEELERRVRVLEQSHKVLIDQMADLTIEHQDMVKNFEKAVESAFDKAVTKFFENLHQKTVQGAGSWLLSSLWSLAKKWLVIAVIVGSIGKAAGWPAAVQAFDWLKGK